MSDKRTFPLDACPLCGEPARARQMCESCRATLLARIESLRDVLVATKLLKGEK